MTQAERTRSIKYALAESSRRLLHRRRDTKKIKHTGMQEKNKKRKNRKTKNEKRKVGSVAQKQANKKKQLFLLLIIVPGMYILALLILVVGGKEARVNTCSSQSAMHH